MLSNLLHHLLPEHHAKRKALLVGIRYSALPTGHQLESTYSDVDHLQNFLANTCHFQVKDIKVMKDDVDPSDHNYPSRENLLKALRDLVSHAQCDDHLVFHFSGHGCQKRDQDGDEVDGFDEAIWPADAKPTGNPGDADNVILDDEIKKTLVDRLPDGAHLVIIMDCCHSGTGADLRYTYTDDTPDEVDGQSRAVEKTHVSPPQKLALKGLTDETKGSDPSSPVITSPGVGPVVVSWAACQDPHTTISFSNSGGYFIKAFIDSFHEKQVATHEELMHSIKVKMGNAAKGHFQERRHLMSEDQWQAVQEWWTQTRSEPVLGVLHDYRGVLRSPVAKTFGLA